MKNPFTRHTVNENASPDLDPVYQADGHWTPASYARIKAAAKRGDVVSMANLGTAMLTAGDRAGALHWLSKAWDAGNVIAGFNLGSMYTMAGDTHRAQVIWERCAKLGDADAMLGLVRQALERGEPASAERWAQAVYSQADAYPITALGYSLAEHGYTSQAIRAFQRSVDLGDAFAMEFLAAIYERQGSHDEAAALREHAATAERML